MTTTYAFIINYNRLTLPRRMADYLAECDGVTPVIIDNKSSYQPLLDYYEESPHRVLHMDKNYGCPVVWNSGILDDFGLDGHFVVTDPDLQIDHIPRDWLHVLEMGLDRHSFACKAGFSLKIDDLPKSPIAQEAKKVERGHWAYPLDKEFYKAYIDTTFCLCRTRLHDFPSIRSAPPYEARHMPWYYTSKDSMPEDEQYYVKSVGGDWNYWTTRIAKMVGLEREA